MTKQEALVNPANWGAAQLEDWLRKFENGRFASLAPQLRHFSGNEVIHFAPARWAQIEPQELATSCRFTLLGMAQVAAEEGVSSPGIVTDFVPLMDKTQSDSKKKDGKSKAAKFPPVIELPTIPIGILLVLFVVVAILCFTALKDPLADAGISSEQLLKYGSIPVVCVAFTYIHIWLALYMTFYPLKYFGVLQIPGTNTGLGWQGIVPSKGEKMARQTCQIMTHKLLSIKEVFSRVEPGRVVEVLEPILFNTIQDIIEDMALKYNPDLWNVLPSRVKDEIIQKVKEEAPAHIEALMNEIKNNIEDVFDLEDMAVHNMMRDPQLLVNMFLVCGYKELSFIRNAGAYMGLLFGLMQMGLWFVYTDRMVVFPVVGLVVGTLTNWLALKMIFNPVNPKRICGITMQGLFLRRQDEVSYVYGRMVASEILTSHNIIEAILKGPYSDRLFELVYENVQDAVNDSARTTERIMNMSIGEDTYMNIKDDVTNHVVDKFPDSLRQIEDYATEALDLETTLREKMKSVSSEEFEQLLHPVFQEDEWKLVLMGGVLGLLIGLLQAFFINH